MLLQNLAAHNTDLEKFGSLCWEGPAPSGPRRASAMASAYADETELVPPHLLDPVRINIYVIPLLNNSGSYVLRDFGAPLLGSRLDREHL